MGTKKRLLPSSLNRQAVPEPEESDLHRAYYSICELSELDDAVHKAWADRDDPELPYVIIKFDEAQALLHGDRSGSIMVLNWIPKWSSSVFIGPMAFDIMTILATSCWRIRPGWDAMNNVADYEMAASAGLSKRSFRIPPALGQQNTRRRPTNVISTEQARSPDAQDQFCPRCLKIPGECGMKWIAGCWFCWRWQAELNTELRAGYERRTWPQRDRYRQCRQFKNMDSISSAKLNKCYR